MSHSVAALSRNLISLLICTALVACSSDVDFNKDKKTADIELENAESITLAAYQSAFLGHFQSAAYLYLDASDLPSGLTPTGVDKQFQGDCENIENIHGLGSAIYTYMRNAGEEHKTGDKVSVVYNNCLIGEQIYNGALYAKYTKLKGLNKRFRNLSTSECVESLKKEISANNANIFSLTGDELQFTRISDELKVENYLNDPDDENNKIFKDEITIHKNTRSIIIHQPSTLPLDEDIVASENGDQVYSVVDGVNKKQQCQSFERTLSVTFDEFSTDKIDYLYTSLNGSVTLFEGQQSQTRMNQSFLNSDFTTTVRQGNSTEVFTMKDYSVQRGLSLSSNSYAYEFDGLVSNSAIFGGVVQMSSTAGQLLGTLDNTYPHKGSITIAGKGLEQIFVFPSYLNVQIQVDYDGDSTGNGIGDVDDVIYTTWNKLFEREFQQ